MTLDEKTIHAIQETLKQKLAHPVEILLFTTDQMTGSVDNRGYNDFAGDLCDELSGMSASISCERHDLFGEQGTALGLALSPTILVGQDGIFPIQYWGAPGGKQGGSFIEAILMTSRREPGLSESSVQKLSGQSEPMLLEYFVTPDCDFCSGAIDLANRIALASGGWITARHVDVTQGMDRALLYNVESVPHLVIDEDPTTSIVGFRNEEELLKVVLGS